MTDKEYINKFLRLTESSKASLKDQIDGGESYSYCVNCNSEVIPDFDEHCSNCHQEVVWIESKLQTQEEQPK